MKGKRSRVKKTQRPRPGPALIPLLGLDKRLHYMTDKIPKLVRTSNAKEGYYIKYRL